MFKHFFQFTIIIMLNTALAFEVQNVVATQSTDGEHVLTVSYDLTGDDVFVSFETHSEISIDGGETWDTINMILPGINSGNGYTRMGGDAYVIAAQDDIVAIVSGNSNNSLRSLWV